MESRKRSEAETSRVLAQLAEIHAGLAQIQTQRRQLIEEVQGRRGDARYSIMRLEDERRRLSARRSRGLASDADDAKLRSLETALEAQKATHVQEVAEYGDALNEAANERGRLRKEAQALEKRRAELAHALPRVFARGYAGLLAQGVADPIVDVSGGSCICGAAVDLAQEQLPNSCEDCERLMIDGTGEPQK